MTDRPLPSLDSEPHRTFWRAAGDERLLVQECADCGSRQLFPRSWCQYCGADEVSWLESEGLGHVHTYTVIRRATELQSFAEEVPYVVAYVELAEGARLCTNVVGCEPAAVENGLPVEVIFDHVTDEVALPKFEPR